MLVRAYFEGALQQEDEKGTTPRQQREYVVYELRDESTTVRTSMAQRRD